MLAFIFAVILLVLTPGPRVLSTAGLGAAWGFRAGLQYVIGLFLGNNLVAFIVVSGMATILFTIPYARTILLILSVSYLIYLAAKIAFAGSKIGFISATGRPGVRAGILLQIINPKAYVVNTTLFTGFVFYPQSLITETLIKFLILNLIWIPVHLLWLWVGGKIQEMQLPEKIQFRVNVTMAIAMLSVVVLALFSTR
ncbi:MAG: LysE family translocator [Gammaproteobacteria bacterium]|nr:LysE family translocator [Gammaproteobacteria bacterium]